MATHFFGAPIKRREDQRLLTGRGRFVADLRIPDLAHVAFLRSPYAHARIRGIDVGEARRAPGVLAVFTAEDLGEAGAHGRMTGDADAQTTSGASRRASARLHKLFC